jgi:hypothetical protein
MALDFVVETTERRIVRTPDPDSCSAREVAKRCVQTVDEFGFHNHMLGLDNIDAMRKGPASQISVEQGDNTADFGDTQPNRQVFRPIRHQQTNRVAFGET